jgi:hypothetical protein
MIRRLNAADIPEMISILRGNNSFFTKPIKKEFKDMLEDSIKSRMEFDNLCSVYFGAFDDDNELVAWSHWKSWQETDDHRAVTFGSIYSTNSKKLKKDDGPYWSSLLVDMVNHALYYFKPLKVYTIAPKNNANWKGWKTVARSELMNYDWQVLGSIPANTQTDNLLWRKHLSGKTIPIDVEIGVFTRKADNLW